MLRRRDRRSAITSKRACTAPTCVELDPSVSMLAATITADTLSAIARGKMRVFTVVAATSIKASGSASETITLDEFCPKCGREVENAICAREVNIDFCAN
eukprot:2759621-Pleurochrysis_carterae.AAC.1